MIRKAIWKIGEDLVKCTQTCADVIHDASKGVLTRCLILDNKERRGRGCLIAGINPGRSKSPEREFYRSNKSTYDAVNSFWMETGRHFAYYKKLREFVDAVGLTGPIIWSDLAKCENGAHHNGLISLQTLRNCTGRYLQKELQTTPKNWPIIGVGAEAYKSLAYLEPDRTVIGIPHPTGSHGQFSSLCKRGKILKSATREINHTLSSVTPCDVDRSKQSMNLNSMAVKLLWITCRHFASVAMVEEATYPWNKLGPTWRSTATRQKAARDRRVGF